MEIPIAIVVGIAVGALGFVPTFKMSTRARKMMVTNNVGALGLLLLSLLVSFIVMLIAIAVCARIARDVLPFFAISIAVGLSATAIIFGIKSNRAKK